MIVIVGVAIGLFRHGDDFGPECAQERDFFRRLRFRNDDDRAIAFRMAEHREANTRVARCALDNGRARFQQPLRFGISDYPQRRPILH